MSIRMFEYDVHISLTYQSSPQSLNFPFSAVLFLQDNKNIPKRYDKPVTQIFYPCVFE